MPEKTRIFIGCSGWWYKDWNETFYPANIDEHERLKYYAKFFNSTEVNVTFYKMPPLNTVRSWVKRTPDKFVFSVKAPQDLTHKMHFLYSERKIKNFFRLLEPLRSHEKLGAILFQAPPEFTKTRITTQRLEMFLRRLPIHDYEFAIEFRHKSWYTADVYDMLRQYGVSFVLVDSPMQNIKTIITSTIIYIRFHGRNAKLWYYYNYKKEELLEWTEVVKKSLLKNARKLYIYFNNHFRGFAPKNAQEFISLLDLSRADLGLPPLQKMLF